MEKEYNPDCSEPLLEPGRKAVKTVYATIRVNKGPASRFIMKLTEEVHSRPNYQTVSIERIISDAKFGFLAGLFVVMTCYCLWPHQSHDAVTVSMPLVCRPSGVLRYEETEFSSQDDICSITAFSEPAYREADKLCVGIGPNETCYSQKVYYQREKHLVEVSSCDGIAHEHFYHCANVVRKYWYACNNVTAHGAELFKVAHMYTKVIITTVKVFNVNDQNNDNEVSTQ